VLRAEDDALAVAADDGGLVLVPRSAIRGVELARGRRSHWKEGAIIGAIGGAAVLVAGYATSGGFCDYDVRCVMYPVVLGGVFAGAGGAAGAAIGNAIKTDRWVVAELGPAKVDVASAGRGLALGFSLTF